MAKRLYITFVFISLVLGYAAFEAYKLDSKLSKNNNQVFAPKILPALDFQNWPLKKEFQIDKNKTIILHFWATWCLPCEKEFPLIIDLASKMVDQEDIVFYLVSVNDQDKDLKKFLHAFGNLPKNIVVLLDNNQTHKKKFGSFKLPETLIYNKFGQYLTKFSGAQDWSHPDFIQYLNSISK